MKEESNAPQPTLIFIPDISGFTKFVHSTEILHSQHIIEELLEALIDANEMDLKVSEIEGDAILFYRTGQAPTAVEVLAQVQRMYVKFHGHLKLYESARICQCGACCTASSSLKLKFVAHYGEITKKQVKEFTKLFGSDVIIAHRLLKNNIGDEEYVLLTHKLLRSCPTWVDLSDSAWIEPIKGTEYYDDRRVEFCHLPLAPLTVHIPEPRIEDYSIHGTKKVLEVEGTINAPLELVFNVSSDLSIRHHWNDDLKGSDRLNTKITRNGSAHRCLMTATDRDPYVISHKFNVHPDKVTWVESIPNHNNELVISLDRIGKKITRMHFAFFGKGNALMMLIFNLLMKKKFMKSAERQMAALNDLCKKLQAENQDHTEQILLAPATA